MENCRRYEPNMVLDSIYNGIVAIDEEGIITYFNKTAERIFEIPAHETIDRYILNILPNTGVKLLECLKTGKPFNGEKLKGEKVTLVSNITPVIRNAKISGVVSVFQDISEIEKISKELDLFKDMKKWLDAVIDSSYDGLWICDHEGKVIRINKASEKINAVKGEEVIGKNMKELVAEGLCDKSVTLEVLKKKTSVTEIQQTKGKNRILATGNPILDEEGEIAFVVTNERDVTELDNLRRQLEETQALAKGYISRLSELEIEERDLPIVIGRSKEMQRIVQTALRVAKVDSTIFLLGESGVGKGMIAKLIHKYSNRKNGPFIRVDCAGIPDTLIESELFGYQKGAFTGAKTEGKPGFFELANKGTLFLDEIGEIPLNFQSKLLRFLEEHEIIRIGGTEPRQIDVRIIAATNKNIEDMVSSKRFREDLYYRLNVVPLFISPLRERRDDILPLVLHFLEKSNKTFGEQRTFSAEAIEAFCKYDFPGNIREVANLVERLVVTAEEDRIDIKNLPSVITGCMTKPTTSAILPEEMPLKETLEKYEGSIIEEAVKRYGSQREAAKILKVDQATISRKIRRHLLLR